MSDTICRACTTCAKGEYEFQPCSLTADTSCDLDVPYYITFIAHIDLDAAQFLAKPRTYLVSVGVSILGIPRMDGKDNNITKDDWSTMTILQKIAAFDNKLGIGDTNETGSGIIKKIFVLTTVRVSGRMTAEALVANNITCDGCFDAMRAVFIAQGFTDSTGKDLLLNISEPMIISNLSFPISNAAPPSSRRPAPFAATLTAVAAALFVPVLHRAARREESQ